MDKILSFLIHYRLEFILGALILIVSYYALASMVRATLAALRRMRREPGWKSERPLALMIQALALAVVALALMVLLAFALTIDLLYEPIQGASRVATIVPAGRSIEIRPLPGNRGVRAQSVRLGARDWAVRGEFILFDGYLEAIGLRSSQRVAEIMGRNSASIPERSWVVGRLARPNAIYAFVNRFDRYLPGLSARSLTSPYVATGSGPWTLIAFDGGYLLLKGAAAVPRKP